jgi:hypothetical protein
VVLCPCAARLQVFFRTADRLREAYIKASVEHDEADDNIRPHVQDW